MLCGHHWGGLLRCVLPLAHAPDEWPGLLCEGSRPEQILLFVRVCFGLQAAPLICCRVAALLARCAQAMTGALQVMRQQDLARLDSEQQRDELEDLLISSILTTVPPVRTEDNGDARGSSEEVHVRLC